MLGRTPIRTRSNSAPRDGRSADVPRNVIVGNDGNHHCKACADEDNTRMVQCDRCDDWYHFECVEVSQGVAHRDWQCSKCLSVSKGGRKKASTKEPSSDPAPKPTVFPAENFNPSADAAALRKAMKGFGTDEQTIIDILCNRCNWQRQVIAETFKNELGRDLIKDLKSELSGKFEDVIIGLMQPPVNYLCKQLYKAMDGIGTNERALIEILCSQNNEQMHHISRVYEEMYNRPLAEHVCTETSGDFRRLLTLIITGTRDPPGTVDPDLAVQQAKQLYDAGEGKWGTDESVFNKILAHSSFDQLEYVFEEYKKLTGRTIEQALKAELSGDLYHALSAIVECVQMAPHFFSKRLFKAMDGLGTDDTTLIRIIVSRSEIDLQNIKDEYEQMYNKTLMSAVKSETSGDYKKALCALIGNA